MMDSHAPQVTTLVLGIILAILTRIGIALTDVELGLLTQALTLIVPVVLAWLTGFLTERFTYSRRTVRSIQRWNGPNAVASNVPTFNRVDVREEQEGGRTTPHFDPPLREPRRESIARGDED